MSDAVKDSFEAVVQYISREGSVHPKGALFCKDIHVTIDGEALFNGRLTYKPDERKLVFKGALNAFDLARQQDDGTVVCHEQAVIILSAIATLIKTRSNIIKPYVFPGLAVQ